MSTTIHSSAIIDSSAELGENVHVGPYTVVGAGVRVGDGTWIDSHVSLAGPLVFGRNCQVHSFASIGKPPQDLKYKGDDNGVMLGDRCRVREYVTINGATQEGEATTLGDDCFLLAYCHVAHDCRLGNGVIMSNGFTLAGHVTVGDRVVCGGLGGVHQFVRIGSLAMISAMCKVVQDVMPFCLVDGNPASLVAVNRIGLERKGKSPETVDAISKAYKILFRSGLLREQAVARVRTECGDIPEVSHMLDFLEEDSDRGITTAHAGRRR